MSAHPNQYTLHSVYDALVKLSKNTTEMEEKRQEIQKSEQMLHTLILEIKSKELESALKARNHALQDLELLRGELVQEETAIRQQDLVLRRWASIPNAQNHQLVDEHAELQSDPEEQVREAKLRIYRITKENKTLQGENERLALSCLCSIRLEAAFAAAQELRIFAVEQAAVIQALGTALKKQSI